MRSLILVSGPPGSGKTTLGRPVAAEIGWPYLEKDVIKEALFESLGTGNESWSLGLSKASFDVMFALARDLDRAVLEGNFGPNHREAIRSLHPAPIEIHCSCDRAERIRRIAGRDRHPGHLDDITLSKAATGVPSEEPLRLGGPFLELDTTTSSDPADVICWLDDQGSV